MTSRSANVDKNTEPNTIKIVSLEGTHVGEIKIETITSANRPTINIRKRLRLKYHNYNHSPEQEQDND